MAYTNHASTERFKPLDHTSPPPQILIGNKHFSLQPVLHDWCNKGRGMCYPVCGMVHIKEHLLLIDKSSLCGGSGFPFSLSEWFLTIYLTPYNRRYNVLSASLNKTFLSLSLSLEISTHCMLLAMSYVMTGTKYENKIYMRERMTSRDGLLISLRAWLMSPSECDINIVKSARKSRALLCTTGYSGVLYRQFDIQLRNNFSRIEPSTSVCRTFNAIS